MDLETYEMLLQMACEQIKVLQEEVAKEKAYNKAISKDLHLANVTIAKFLKEDE